MEDAELGHLFLVSLHVDKRLNIKGTISLFEDQDATQTHHDDASIGQRDLGKDAREVVIWNFAIITPLEGQLPCVSVHIAYQAGGVAS